MKKLFLLSICFSCLLSFAQKIPCKANWTKGMEFTYNIVRQQLMKIDMGILGEDEYEEDEVRLMRIKFMSDVGN